MASSSVLKVATDTTGLAHLADQQLGELVSNRLMDQDTARCAAFLAAVPEPGFAYTLGRGFQVGVLEHDNRRLAAQLQVHTLDGGGCAFGDLLSAEQRGVPGRDDAGQSPYKVTGRRRTSNFFGVFVQILGSKPP